jgi:hypothetical protein
MVVGPAATLFPLDFYSSANQMQAISKGHQTQPKNQPETAKFRRDVSEGVQRSFEIPTKLICLGEQRLMPSAANKGTRTIYESRHLA